MSQNLLPTVEKNSSAVHWISFERENNRSLRSRFENRSSFLRCRGAGFCVTEISIGNLHSGVRHFPKNCNLRAARTGKTDKGIGYKKIARGLVVLQRFQIQNLTCFIEPRVCDACAKKFLKMQWAVAQKRSRKSHMHCFVKTIFKIFLDQILLQLQFHVIMWTCV